MLIKSMMHASNFSWLWFLPLVCLLLSSPSRAEERLTGLLLNQTTTLFGQKIYQQFSWLWTEHADRFKDNLVVKEHYNVRQGSTIIVSTGDDEIYRVVLQPRSSNVVQEARQAIDAVYNRLRWNASLLGKRLNKDRGASGW